MFAGLIATRIVATRQLQEHRLRRHALDEIGAIVPDIADLLVDGTEMQHVLGRWPEERGRISIDLAKPERPILRFGNHRHAFLDCRQHLARVRRGSREGLHRLAFGRTPRLPDTAECDRIIIHMRDRERDFALGAVAPFVVNWGRDQTSQPVR
jgi:hypothetical protein